LSFIAKSITITMARSASQTRKKKQPLKKDDAKEVTKKATKAKVELSPKGGRRDRKKPEQAVAAKHERNTRSNAPKGGSKSPQNQTAKGGGKKGKKEKKEKPKPEKQLTAEELDKQMDDYHMKDDKVASKMLDEDMDDYWEKKKTKEAEAGEEKPEEDVKAEVEVEAAAEEAS
jgi:hypothetical protein